MNNNTNITYPEKLVFGLDIGTRSVVGTVGYKDGTNHFTVVAQVALEHETRAMMDGQIHDINKVAETILKIKQSLEKTIGHKLTEVCIAAAGRVLKTVEASAEMDFNNDVTVTNEHIYSLEMLGVENAYGILREKRVAEDGLKFYCVGYSVVHYYQNDYAISNLEGHKAKKIKTDLIATFLPEEVVDGLYTAVERAGLLVANLTLEPIAAINVAIPERFRLLNIALVDVGAGTSDISITKDGSIIAYGMIPYAGDELTECIAKHYLTDFTEAEHIKCTSTTADEVTFKDIMGLPQTVSSEEVTGVVAETIDMITKNVADKIKELNGDKTVSAVFIVGGGGKITGFSEKLAQYLDLSKERVALRGAEVLNDVTFLQKGIVVDSLIVTPIGICLNYYEQRNNFIFVSVNGERIKLYDNSKLTIMDAAMQVGVPNEDLFPKRGNELHYSVNGEARMKRGEQGEAAVIYLNGEEAGLNTPIAQNNQIEIKESTRGANAKLEIGDVPEFSGTIHFTFNSKQISCPCFAKVGDDLVSKFYEVKDGDAIEILPYYTVSQIFEFMDLIQGEKVYVNNMLANSDTKVYDNFTLSCEIKQSEHNYEMLKQQYGEELFSVPEIPDDEKEYSEQVDMDAGKDLVATDVDEKTKEMTSEPSNESEQLKSMVTQSVPTTGASAGNVELSITVNGDLVVLKNKPQYIFVDILDFYPFDLSVLHGRTLETRVNGKKCDFMEPLHAGDEAQIYWVK